MKKSLFFAAAFVSAMLLTGCTDTQTPDTDTTKLWWAMDEDTQLYGYIDANGKMVIPAKYQEASWFSCGWARVVDEDGVYTFIDKKGNRGNAPDLEYAYSFYHKAAIVKMDGKWGQIDSDLRIAIEPEYKNLGDRGDNGLSSFYDESVKKEGYLDEKGNVAIEPDFYSVGTFADNASWVTILKNDVENDGIIDGKGNWLLEPSKKWISNEGEGIFAFKKSYEADKYGLMDKKGNVIVEPTYDNTWSVCDGLIMVEKNDKYGYIDKKGNVVLPLQYYAANSFNDGIAVVMRKEGGRYEVIDKKGNTLFKLKEGEEWWNFHNGLVLAYTNNTDGSRDYRYLNKNGETIYSWTRNAPKAPKRRMVLPGLYEDELTPQERQGLTTEQAPLIIDRLRKEQRMK